MSEGDPNMAAHVMRVDVDRLQSIVDDLGPNVAASLDAMIDTIVELYTVTMILAASSPIAHQHGLYRCALCMADAVRLERVEHDPMCPWVLARTFIERQS
jgi:hypothetical protein